MLTRAKIGRDQDLTHDSWIGAAFTGLLLFGVMAYSLIDAFGWTRTPLPADTRIATANGSNTATVSDSIFPQYLDHYDAVSVLLASAPVRPIHLVRTDSGGPTAPHHLPPT